MPALLKKIKTEITIPGDKSISHRSVIISALCKGETVVENFLSSEDTQTTVNLLKKTGVDIFWDKTHNRLKVRGFGLFLPAKEKVSLYAGESGTTIRILSGVLSGQKFSSVINSAHSLEKRPMKRITFPLRQMGADIYGRQAEKDEYPPLKINPSGKLKGINYAMPVASAQVKSCLLLAGLYAEGKTTVIEPYPSRDHTERMLSLFNADITKGRRRIVIRKCLLKSPGQIFVPGDFSSAAYFIGLGVLTGNSLILLKKVSLNPTRTGLLRVLRKMGAVIKMQNKQSSYFEPYADIWAKPSRLHGVEVCEAEIASMIDEVPLLLVLACFAEGKTVISGLKELKVKETNRINSMVYNLRKIGGKIEVENYLNQKGQKDCRVIIYGGRRLKPAKIKTFNDHRTAMSMAIAVLSLGARPVLDNEYCINKSFPDFLNIINSAA